MCICPAPRRRSGGAHYLWTCQQTSVIGANVLSARRLCRAGAAADKGAAHSARPAFRLLLGHLRGDLGATPHGSLPADQTGGIEGGVGLFYQEPDPYTGQTDKNFGNPDLKAERAIHYSLGVEWRPREHLHLDLTGFYKDLSNWISTPLRSGPTVPRCTLTTTAPGGSMHGSGGAPRFDRQFTGWLAYTLSHATRRDSADDVSPFRVRSDPHPDRLGHLPVAA